MGDQDVHASTTDLRDVPVADRSQSAVDLRLGEGESTRGTRESRVRQQHEQRDSEACEEEFQPDGNPSVVDWQYDFGSEGFTRASEYALTVTSPPDKAFPLAGTMSALCATGGRLAIPACAPLRLCAFGAGEAATAV